MIVAVLYLRLQETGPRTISVEGRDYQDAGSCPKRPPRLTRYDAPTHNVPSDEEAWRTTSSAPTPAVLYVLHGHRCSRAYALVGGP
jgi:hypothetical protein